MIVSTFESNNRRAVICSEDNGLVVRLYENGVMVGVRDLHNYSIHYAESLAENFVEFIGEFYTPKTDTRKFLTE